MRLHNHVFFHSNTCYGQRLLSLKNNGNVHLHLIVQYAKKYGLFWIQYEKNIGRSRGTNKGRSLDGFITCRIKHIYYSESLTENQTSRKPRSSELLEMLSVSTLVQKIIYWCQKSFIFTFHLHDYDMLNALICNKCNSAFL